MSGWMTVRRDVFEHPLFERDEYSRRDAWLWLIAKAAWKPTKFDIGGKIVTLNRGQICVSRSQLAKAWKWSESAVERFLSRLKTEQMIGRETGQGKSVITVCNYAKYQQIDDKPGQATGQVAGQRSDSDRTAKEQENKRTKGKKEEPDGSSISLKPASPDGFDAFWKAYPRRVGKEAARKAWASCVKRGVEPWHMTEGAEWLAAHPPDDPQFIPHPATWLNQGRYDDERTENGNRPMARNGSEPATGYRRDPAWERFKQLGADFAADPDGWRAETLEGG